MLQNPAVVPPARRCWAFLLPMQHYYWWPGWIAWNPVSCSQSPFWPQANRSTGIEGHRLEATEFLQSIQNTPKVTQEKIPVVDYIYQHMMQLKVFWQTKNAITEITVKTFRSLFFFPFCLLPQFLYCISSICPWTTSIPWENWDNNLKPQLPL